MSLVCKPGQWAFDLGHRVKNLCIWSQVIGLNTLVCCVNVRVLANNAKTHFADVTEVHRSFILMFQRFQERWWVRRKK